MRSVSPVGVRPRLLFVSSGAAVIVSIADGCAWSAIGDDAAEPADVLDEGGIREYAAELTG